ncbi:MAG: phosphatidate cytidylyltransferase [Desulfobaccales bacterium]
MHLQRWLTALVLIPLIIAVLLKGGRLAFVAALLLVNGLAQWEFLRLFQPEVDKARKIKMVSLGSLLILSFVMAATPRGGAVILLILVGCLFALLLFYLLSYEHMHNLVYDLAVNTLGLLYLPLLLGHFVWLRYMSQGEWWVLWLLVVICSGDTAAFYVGRTWGERKFYPQVSPGKTWAGTCGGLAANLAAGVVSGHWLLPEVSFFSLAGISVVLGIIGLLGDLFESMLKRQAEVKDAGSLLPGHGGMLDRLDSLLFAAPALAYIRLFFLNLL